MTAMNQERELMERDRELQLIGSRIRNEAKQGTKIMNNKQKNAEANASNGFGDGKANQEVTLLIFNPQH